MIVTTYVLLKLGLTVNVFEKPFGYESNLDQKKKSRVYHLYPLSEESNKLILKTNDN